MNERGIQLFFGGDFLTLSNQSFQFIPLTEQNEYPHPKRLLQLTLDDALMNHLAIHEPLEFLKRKYGCVLRAISSIAEADVPEQVWCRRLEQVTHNPQPLMELILGQREPDDLDEEVEWLRLREDDFAEIRDLLADLQNSKTPLGDSLRKFDIRNQLLGMEDMKMLLLEGSQILLLAFNHLAHLAYDRKNNILRSRSDEGFEVFLERGAYYQTFVFSQKKPRRSFFRMD